MKVEWQNRYMGGYAIHDSLERAKACAATPEKFPGYFLGTFRVEIFDDGTVVSTKEKQ